MKLKLNRQLECKLLKKPINVKVCNDCPFKQLKTRQISMKIQSKSNTLTRLEKSRKSLFTIDLERCYICNKPKEHLHEVCFGKNRQNSMKYGLVLPLCSKCHRLMHNDIKLQYEYKKKGQVLFNKTYPDLDFISIFRENYLK